MSDISLYTIDGLRITHDGEMVKSEDVRNVNAVSSTDCGQQLVGLYNLFLLMHNVNCGNSNDVSLQFVANCKKANSHREVRSKLLQEENYSKENLHSLENEMLLENENYELMSETLKAFPYKAFFLPAEQTSETLYANKYYNISVNEDGKKTSERKSDNEAKEEGCKDEISVEASAHCANVNRSANGWEEIIVRQNFGCVNRMKSDESKKLEQIYVPAELKVETSANEWLCAPVRLTQRSTSASEVNTSDEQPLVFCCARKQVQEIVSKIDL